MLVNIHSLCSILLMQYFGNNYSLEYCICKCDATSLAHESVSSFALFPFAAPLKLHEVEWGASVRNHFQFSPEMFDQIQGHLQSCAMVVLVVCFGSFSFMEPLPSPVWGPQSLWSRFSFRMSLYIAASSFPHSWLVFQFIPLKTSSKELLSIAHK